MTSVNNNSILLQLVYSIGKFIKHVNNRSIYHIFEDPLTNKQGYTKEAPLTYREYSNLKLMDSLKSLQTNDGIKFPIDIVNIIINYTNGEIFKCKTCKSKVMLFNTKQGKFNRHELSQNGFELLKDNSTILCNSCCHFNGCVCLYCGHVSYDLYGFKAGLCDYCQILPGPTFVIYASMVHHVG